MDEEKADKFRMIYHWIRAVILVGLLVWLFIGLSRAPSNEDEAFVTEQTLNE